MILLIITIVEAVIILVGVTKMLRTKYDGSMIVTETPEKKTFSLEVDTDPDELDQKKQIVLKVTKISEE